MLFELFHNKKLDEYQITRAVRILQREYYKGSSPSRVKQLFNEAGFSFDSEKVSLAYISLIVVLNKKWQYEQGIDQIKEKPYWLYTGVHNGLKCEGHYYLEHQVFRKDNRIWNRIFPPNCPGCRCEVTGISEQEKQNFVTTKYKESELLRDVCNLDWSFNPAKVSREFIAKKIAEIFKS